MAKSYSLAAARAHLPQLLDDAEAGKDVRLTRRGHPIAVLLSLGRYEALQRGGSNFGDAYRAFVERHGAKTIGLGSDYFTATRERTAGRKVPL